MFQNFQSVADPTAVPPRVAALRARLDEAGLDGVLIPRADRHQGEYVAPCDERLRWISGFDGSAGLAAVLRQSAALFVDGRYTTQAARQAPTDLFEIVKVPDARHTTWLKEALGGLEAPRLAIDPTLHTIDGVSSLKAAMETLGGTLVYTPDNLIDGLWKDRPTAPDGPLRVQSVALAGRTAADKIAEMQSALVAAGQAGTVLTATDSVAWLLNLRSSDLPHTPSVRAFALVPATGKVQLGLDADRVPAGADHASFEAVGEAGFLAALTELASSSCDASKGVTSGAIRLDPAQTGVDVADQITAAGGTVVHGRDLALDPKAAKTDAEIAGSRAAHLRDGVAMTRFLAWLSQAAPSGGVSEITAAQTLEGFRRDTGALVDISFDTISGAGPNGAIVHYRVTEATDAALTPGSLYLVDSGGQYRDGTTDITRTIAVGTPSAQMRSDYTRVLKGHIAVSTARFPAGSRGVDLDPFARRALWEAGLDYDHGTGHGIGSFLSVHEGPASISKRGMVALVPGMILSNEPGLYRVGQYGIRIENLVLVEPASEIAGGERAMLSFETLTLAPYDRALIDTSLLTADEVNWLNAYHARVRDALTPMLDEATVGWLDGATAPFVG